MANGVDRTDVDNKYGRSDIKFISFSVSLLSSLLYSRKKIIIIYILKYEKEMFK